MSSPSPDENKMSMFKTSKGALPPKVDLRPNMPPIVGFGSGSCSSTADALCTAVEFFQMKMGKRWKPSRLFVQYNERLGMGSKEVPHIWDAIASLQKYGVCSEFSWPFDPAMAAVPPHVSCYLGLSNKAVHTQSIPSSTPVIKKVLDAGMPIVVGIKAHMGCRAVLVVGYDDESDEWIVRGDKGYFNLSYDYLVKRCSDMWYVFTD
jgi:hypothetical protein